MNDEAEARNEPDEQIGTMQDLLSFSFGLDDDVEEKRKKLKRQRQEMLAEQNQTSSKDTIASKEESWTQVPSRNSGTHRNSGTQRSPSGMQRIASGIHQVNNGGDMQADEISRMLALPLPEYVLYACEKNEVALELAEEWQGPAFTFTRYMKSHPNLKGLSAVNAADKVGTIIDQMYPESDCPWSELLGDSDSRGNENDAFDHFVESWDSIKVPLGESPIEQAVRFADKYPVELPKYSATRWRPYLRFLSICRGLQIAQGAESIFLPVRKISDLMGKPTSSISNYRKRAINDGLLTLVNPHQGRRKATEFRFNFENLPGNSESASPDLDECTGDWGEIA